MAIDKKDTKPILPEGNASIVSRLPQQSPLKSPSPAKLKPEHDAGFQKMVTGVTKPSEEEIAFERLKSLALLERTKAELTESSPNFNTLFDEPVTIGEQKFDSREDVAKGIDRLKNISDIARGKTNTQPIYDLDFSGMPLDKFSGNTATGNWNKLSFGSVKVDKNFSLNGSFQQAFQVVLASEGGFSNHSADKGGATIYGIASRSNPREYQQIMDQLSRGDKAGAMQTTMMTYKTKYWDSIVGIESMSPSARLVAFDAAVNHGVGFANKMIKATGADADAMIDYRAHKYASIIQNDPSQAVFEKGWGNRLAKLDSLTSTSERNLVVASAQPSSKANIRNPAPEPA